MYRPNHVSQEGYRPPVDPDRAAAMGGMALIAEQHAEATAALSNGILSPSDVQKMTPDKQAELHHALKINAAGDAQQAQIDQRYREIGLR